MNLYLKNLKKRRGKSRSSDRFYFGELQNHCEWDCSHEIRMLLLGRKAMRNLESILKHRDITLLTKAHIVKAYGFSSSYVQM